MRLGIAIGLASLLGLVPGAPAWSNPAGVQAKPALGWLPGERAYEDRQVGHYRLLGTTLPLPEKKQVSAAGGERRFFRYRLFDTTAKSQVWEIRCSDLARAQGQAEEAASDPYRGLLFLAFNGIRREVYLTSVVDAARTVTRELFAVPLTRPALHSLGTFTTAGEGLTAIQVAPSGQYLSFLGLWGNHVLQGLTVIRVDDGQTQEWPDDAEAGTFRARYPAWALTITDYRWQGQNDLLFHQQIVPSPNPSPDAGESNQPPGLGQRQEKWVDVREGRLVRETVQQP